MAAERPATPSSVTLGLVLTAIAGFVDAVGYLSLGRILPANVSGNTVESGLAWLRGDGAEGLRKLWVVVLFGVGAFASAALHARGQRGNGSRVVPIAFLIEAALLMLWWGLSLAWPEGPGVAVGPLRAQGLALLTVAPLAMGIQNASLTQVGPVRAFTTHVTGTLTKLAESLARGERRTGAIMAGLWASFFAGAALGGAAMHTWKAHALLPAVGTLGLIAVWTWYRPVPRR